MVYRHGKQKTCRLWGGVMEKQIEIKYTNGQMTINLDKFFPSTQKDCKKLLAVIDLDWTHRDELIQSILNWMENEQKECDDYSKEYANKYVDIKPKIKEAEAKVNVLKNIVLRMKTDKLKDPLKVAREDLQKAKAEFRHLKNNESYYNSSFNNFHNRKEKLQKNMQILEERR
jgi:chromosome segregation ATPase